MNGGVPGEIFSFGRFMLDPVERRLSVDGVPVAIGATAFNVLVALVERAGSIVAKDEIISRVWGYSDVGDNRVHVHINALRKIVGKNSIVTKNSHGYRFETQVHRILKLPQSGASQQGNISGFWGAAERRNRLIGRTEQLGILSDVISRGRLVTLTGTGGVGKTSLALEGAKQALPGFVDGAWLSELAPLNDPQLVASAVASALGVKIGVNANPIDAITRYLARKSMLIVLDNCEHIIASVVELSEAVLASAPGVKILTTSREPLGSYGERVVEVLPLALPGESILLPAALRSIPSVELFIERAKDADATFQVDDKNLLSVARICRRVDGLPLAIEMVAGWAGPLGTETLAAKLDEGSSSFLRARNRTPQRHSTLRATLEWSYSLLSAAEQSVLCRLAAFASSFTMVAAETVAAGNSIPKNEVFEHVTNLVRKCMIGVTSGSRFQQYHLLETTRAFALEELVNSGSENEARNRHAHYVLNVLETASCELETTSDAVWLERYGALVDDLRAALDWAMSEDSDAAVALAGASWPLWRQLSLQSEARRRLSAAASRLRVATPPALEARLRCGLGHISANTPAMQAAHTELERAVYLYRALGDLPQLGVALTALAWSLMMLGRTEEADQTILEAQSLVEPAGWLRTTASTYMIQLCIEMFRGRFEEARTAGQNAARFCDMAGADRMALVVAANLVQLCVESGDFENAISAGRELVVRLEDTRHSDLRGFALGVIAASYTARSDLTEALIAAREAAPLLRDEGMLFWLFDHLALRVAFARRARDGALIAGYANAVHEKFGHVREPMGRRAVKELNLLLRGALSEEEISKLARLGAQLPEEQALAVALSE